MPPLAVAAGVAAGPAAAGTAAAAGGAAAAGAGGSALAGAEVAGASTATTASEVGVQAATKPGFMEQAKAFGQQHPQLKNMAQEQFGNMGGGHRGGGGQSYDGNMDDGRGVQNGVDGNFG